MDLDIFRVRSLIKKLDETKGNGTSMISLIIPPGDQISRIQKMLTEEYGTATNIKSRVNRLSVLSAIVSTQQKLKLYSRIPENGLILYCGTILDNNNKEKKVFYDIIPHKKINTSLYLCDNKFHIDILYGLLEEDQNLGFIIIDGKSTLIGKLKGGSKEILHKFYVDLPKKHGRGGQSAVRFSRLRTEKRLIYLKKVSELCEHSFIFDNHVQVSGIIVAGSAEFKNELTSLNYFPQKIHEKILKVVDVAHGGERGLDQALKASEEILKNLRFNKEQKIVREFFEQIARDTGKYVFGLHETFDSLKSGAVDEILIWDNLEVGINFEMSEGDHPILFNKENNEIEETVVEWLISNVQSFGARISLISDRTPEGIQFIKGFGGIGGILRYSITN